MNQLPEHTSCLELRHYHFVRPVAYSLPVQLPKDGLDINHMRKSLPELLVVLGIFLGSRSGALANSVTGGQTLSANLGANAKLSVVQSSVTLLNSGMTFGDFTGAVTILYKVRTTPSGSSTLVVNAASDFSPANGPSIANSDLSYTCSGATLGSACSGSQIVLAPSTTNVVTVGAGACSGSGCAGPNPSSVSVSLTLANSPTFKTGVYTTSLTFSISSL
jgi:hypothetical protein